MHGHLTQVSLEALGAGSDGTSMHYFAGKKKKQASADDCLRSAVRGREWAAIVRRGRVFELKQAKRETVEEM